MAVYSAQWHRIARLKPRLAPQASVCRQHLRGETWYVLADDASHRSVRLNRAAYRAAARLDGTRSAQQLWDLLQAIETDPPTQDELVELLARLREAGLVQFDRPADFAALLPHLDAVARPRGRNSLLAWRLPLGNPAPLLARLRPLQQVLFTTPAAWLWVAAVLVLVALALTHWGALWAHGALWLATPRYALLAAALYVPIKLVHELAHALAVRRFGGAVHEAGVTLMLGLPVPYVDASAAARFAQRRQRLLVGAAGVMAELALAAAALPLWLWLDDGLARDAAFVTLVIAGVSTLLFNGNPLQRFDAYYILVDLFDLPNLGSRSRQWWHEQLRRHLLRLHDAEPMPLARGERAWLALYAPLSWAYLLAIVAVAVFWLGSISFALGLVAAVALGWQLLAMPALELARQLHRAARGQSRSWLRLQRGTVAAAALAAVALAVPLPRATVAQGVVWPADQAQLRAEADGFVQRVLRGHDEPVGAGEVVIELANPRLDADHARQGARVAALESELYQTLPGDSARAGNVRAELDAALAELARLDEERAGLLLRAQVAGRVALPNGDDLHGRFVKRGSLLGQVLTGEPPRVRVALPEDEAAGLAPRVQAVSLRLADARAQRHEAAWIGDSVGASRRLPSAALASTHGGSIAVDPKDPEGLRPLQPVVLLDVRVAGEASAGDRIGTRAWVRFDEGYSPLAAQLARAAQRRLQARFNPQF